MQKKSYLCKLYDTTKKNLDLHVHIYENECTTPPPSLTHDDSKNKIRRDKAIQTTAYFYSLNLQGTHN